ncbi:MAG: peptidoglycan DD-metalloendopeptidase family protein [Ignavibacteriales bacterium]|nr:peptidoglycan DD-metalloendopeptidase family protein [Ignavibacteriales bacterium]
MKSKKKSWFAKYRFSVTVLPESTSRKFKPRTLSFKTVLLYASAIALGTMVTWTLILSQTPLKTLLFSQGLTFSPEANRTIIELNKRVNSLTDEVEMMRRKNEQLKAAILLGDSTLSTYFTQPEIPENDATIDDDETDEPETESDADLPNDQGGQDAYEPPPVRESPTRETPSGDTPARSETTERETTTERDDPAPTRNRTTTDTNAQGDGAPYAGSLLGALRLAQAAETTEATTTRETPTSILPTANRVNDVVYFRAPIRGFVTRGYDPATGHFGVDFAAKTGTPVLAAADGYVISADYSFEDGHTLIVAHPDGYMTVYKHCERLLARVRERVTRGEAIALCGDTGERSTGPHLHFELWSDGAAIDPTEYLTDY